MSIHALKATGKSKALAVTLSDTKAKTKSNNSDDEGILKSGSIHNRICKRFPVGRRPPSPGTDLYHSRRNDIKVLTFSLVSRSGMPSPLQSILLKGLQKLLMKKKTWWSQNLKSWMSKMTSIQPMQNYTRSRKSMRNCIG